MCAANLGSIWTKLWSDRSSFDHLGIWWSGWWTYLHNVMNSNEICVHISHVCPNFYWIFYELKDVPADFCNFSKYGASLLKFFHLNLNCIFVQSIRGVQRMETMTMERNVTYDAYEYSTSFPFERSFDQWHYKRWTEENWVSDSMKTGFECLRCFTGKTGLNAGQMQWGTYWEYFVKMKGTWSNASHHVVSQMLFYTRYVLFGQVNLRDSRVQP